MFPRQDPSDEAQKMISVFRQSAAEAGKEPDDLGINATVFANQGAGPGEWREVMNKWENMGANEFTFRTAESGLKNLDEHLQVIQGMAGER